MRYFTILHILILLLASFAIVSPAAAETRYVSDELIITLRPGKSTQHKIIKTLKSGTPLEILEEDKDYLKVRTADGIEGFVLRQYISSEPPKAQRIQELENRNISLAEQVRSLGESRSSLETELATLKGDYQQELAALSAKTAELEQNLQQALSNERLMAEKYDILLTQAGNVVEIAAERDRLAQRNEDLATEMQMLARKNEKLADARMVKWFLAGGGVFFFGWIIGKISRKKRSRF